MYPQGLVFENSEPEFIAFIERPQRNCRASCTMGPAGCRYSAQSFRQSVRGSESFDRSLVWLTGVFGWRSNESVSEPILGMRPIYLDSISR